MGKSGMRNIMMILMSLISFSTVLFSENILTEEDSVQRIEKYRNLPDHKAIYAAIEGKEHRAIGYAEKQKSLKAAKEIAYQKCQMEKSRMQVKASCKILALDNAIGCQEIKSMLKSRSKKQSERLKRIHTCLEQNDQTQVEKCVVKNHLSSKILPLWKNKSKRERTLAHLAKVIEEGKTIQKDIDRIECIDYKNIR